MNILNRIQNLFDKDEANIFNDDKTILKEFLTKSYAIREETLSNTEMEDKLKQYIGITKKYNHYHFPDFFQFAHSYTLDGGTSYYKHKDHELYLTEFYSLMCGSSDRYFIIGLIREPLEHDYQTEFDIEKYVIPNAMFGYPSSVSIIENKIIYSNKKYDNFIIGKPSYIILDKDKNIIDKLYYINPEKNSYDMKQFYPKSFIETYIDEDDKRMIGLLYDFQLALREYATEYTFSKILEFGNLPKNYEDWDETTYDKFYDEMKQHESTKNR